MFSLFYKGRQSSNQFLHIQKPPTQKALENPASPLLSHKTYNISKRDGETEAYLTTPCPERRRRAARPRYSASVS